MDQLIELIFDNLFFVVIIIGAIFSMFKGKENKEEQQERQQVPQQIKTTPSVPKSNQPRHVKTHAERKKAELQLSVEEQRAEQMKQLAMNVGSQHTSISTISQVKPGDGRRSLEINDLTSNYNHEKFKGNFKESLTKEGLVNSIVMAEVLGVPRARNPYQSVTAKRRA